MDEHELLHDFDHSAQLVEDFVVVRYGEADAQALMREARQEYEAIIPRIPKIPGLRARVFNAFLRITAQEIAVYKAMKKRGRTAAEAWEICQEAIRLNMEVFPRWKAALLRRLMFSSLSKKVMRRRAQQRDPKRVGAFEMRYIAGNGDGLHFGVDYTRCGNLELAKALGASEFAPYICMSDIPLSEGLGWGLTRTKTLADGCDHCDFRFRKGGATLITSKTPEVQATIETIKRRTASVHGSR